MHIRIFHQHLPSGAGAKAALCSHAAMGPLWVTALLSRSGGNHPSLFSFQLPGLGLVWKPLALWLEIRFSHVVYMNLVIRRHQRKEYLAFGCFCKGRRYGTMIWCMRYKRDRLSVTDFSDWEAPIEVSGQFFPFNHWGQHWRWVMWNGGWNDTIVLNCAVVLTLTKNIWVSQKMSKIEQLLQAYWKESLENLIKKMHKKRFLKAQKKVSLFCLMMERAELQDTAHPFIIWVFKYSVLKGPLL